MTAPNLNTRPPFRRLRGYAFDPVASLSLDTAEINEIVYLVPWEDGLKPGPEGEYIQVIDRDPASSAVYRPVDLNDPAILATEGLSPSESNPQFHQQMVYAVIMTTIKHFEKALGRLVLWSPVQWIDADHHLTYEFVDKLLVYPHAFRDQNAYYSPDRKVLLFGYYNATPVKADIYLPGGTVYACLSHDIIAHETTHALLDGLYSRYMEVTHPDVAGFHEGFADLVALFQHFTYPSIVRNQVRKARGRLDTENLLGKLAVEFGQSTGEYSALRDAIGHYTDDGTWVRHEASTEAYEKDLECHDRGALLVAAVFDAYLAIYQNRSADLIRLATGGTGILPAGDIHPDLVNRLADEAAKVASHMLNMVIRALDYCPPIDLTYGDYLRALITADKELVVNDDKNYRIAFINAFRKRGIFPQGVANLSVDTLCYSVVERERDKLGFSEHIAEFLRGFKAELAYETDRRKIFEKTRDFIRGDKTAGRRGFHQYLFDEAGIAQQPVLFEDLTGLVFSDSYKDLGIATSATYKRGPSVEIHTLRILNRPGPDGNIQDQIILTLAQRCTVTAYTDRKGGTQFRKYRKGDHNDPKVHVMTFRGGCTLIFDLNDLTLRHAISRPLFHPSAIGKRGTRRKLRWNVDRLTMQLRCEQGDLAEKMGFAARSPHDTEPFAFIHQPQNPIV